MEGSKIDLGTTHEPTAQELIDEAKARNARLYAKLEERSRRARQGLGWNPTQPLIDNCVQINLVTETVTELSDNTADRL